MSYCGASKSGGSYLCDIDFLALSDVGTEKIREELETRFKCISVEGSTQLAETSLAKLAIPREKMEEIERKIRGSKKQ